MDERTAYVDRLIRNYEPYYDIEMEKESHELPLIARCIFDVHSGKYVLVKKAVLYEADSHEYLYIFSAPHFDEELYERCHQAAYEMGMEKVDPKPGHMYSYITAVYICDTCDESVIKKLKKTKIRKNFLFSFRGWMEFHAAVVRMDDRSVAANRAGRENARFLKKLLQY